MFERIVYLVRHGQCEPQDTTREYVDVPLTPVGREQAVATAERLRDLNARAIYCSTLRRARETAEIVATRCQAPPLRASMLLRELPDFRPRADETARERIELGKRREARAFAYYVRPADSSMMVDIVVTHGNLVRYFVCRILGMPPESMPTFGTSHCGITQLHVSGDGRMRLISYNDTGHLPERLRT